MPLLHIGNRPLPADGSSAPAPDGLPLGEEGLPVLGAVVEGEQPVGVVLLRAVGVLQGQVLHPVHGLLGQAQGDRALGGELPGQVERGGQIQSSVRVWDTAAAQQVVGNSYQADPQSERRIAHIVSDAIYAALERCGLGLLSKLRVLEPAAGVGHFFENHTQEVTARIQRWAERHLEPRP